MPTADHITVFQELGNQLDFTTNCSIPQPCDHDLQQFLMLSGKKKHSFEGMGFPLMIMHLLNYSSDLPNSHCKNVVKLVLVMWVPYNQNALGPKIWSNCSRKSRTTSVMSVFVGIYLNWVVELS